MSSPFLRFLVLPVLFSAVTHANLDRWRVSQLPVAAAGDNNWYFFPDQAKNPRVLVKATGTGNNVNRRLLTGGPPTWTAEPAKATANLNKQGVTVPFLNGMYLIAAHNTALRMTFFDSGGTSTVSEVIDNTVPVTSTGLSASVDTDGNLHVFYIGRAGTSTETVRYARRTTSGTWIKTSLDLSTETSPVVRDSVILPSSETSATVYASLKTGTVVTLLRLSVNITGSLARFSNPANLGNNIAEPIAGNRLGGADRVYYFLSNGQNGWNMRQVNDPDPIQTIGVALPTSIICKPGPDNKQRVVWLDGLAKKIHYLKPSTDPQKVFDVLHPVTGTTGGAEVRGLHFDPGNKPYLLYRHSSSLGYIAYPDEDFDSDGNGRADLIDYAFNSSTAGIEVIPPAQSVPGLPLPENKFKFRIPTIGSSFSNGAGGLFSSSKNLTYSVQTSTDAVNWTTLGAGSPMFFIEHSVTGTFPDQLKTFTGMYNETIPAAPARRFFRIRITRPASAY